MRVVISRASGFIGAALARGEMPDALLLAGTRMVPGRLDEAGFTFRFPALEGALRDLLARRTTA